jgi:formylglycine-generating enzyme required for sulfatase activity
LSEAAWYKDNSGQKPQPVGAKLPNGLGLFDMTGNVLEWCTDWYDQTYYKRSPKENPQGPDNGQENVDTALEGSEHKGNANAGPFRVLRGSSWNSDASESEANYYRNHGTPNSRANVVGFRVVFNGQ